MALGSYMRPKEGNRTMNSGVLRSLPFSKNFGNVPFKGIKCSITNLLPNTMQDIPPENHSRPVLRNCNLCIKAQVFTVL